MTVEQFTQFKVGDRVKTAEAYHGNPKRKGAARVERHGTVTGKSALYSDSYRVTWDHKPTPDEMHARWLVRE